ncbi:Integral membrane protein Srb [Trichostrongylus colubriformis]|uniref:Integral membrane protein Srb n=1 Tax=Trichostrongylus colubriformis TaxID=6319 RepID=A0AAN8FCI1_TRICO
MMRPKWDTNDSNFTDYNFTEVCVKNGVEVVTFPYYRVMQCLHIVLCISSIILLLWVLAKYRSKLMFHYNIRVLFMSLCFASLLHASLMAVFNSYQLILSFTYTSPCDVILSRLFYACIHLPYAFSVLWIESAQLTMVLERIIAILYVKHYETCTKKLGNSLLFFSFFFPLTEVIWVYVDEKFEAPQISCLNTPVTRTKQVNMLFFFTFICHIIAIFAIITVFLCHRHRSSTSHTLTSRFQFSENMISSRLLITISTTQLVIFLTYGIAMMYLRLCFDPTKESLPMLKANVLSAYGPENMF